jgi:hypothetical protein
MKDLELFLQILINTGNKDRNRIQNRIRNRIRNSEFRDPDPEGPLFTDSLDPDPQHCYETHKEKNMQIFVNGEK